MAQKFAHGKDRCRVSRVCLIIFVFSLVHLLEPNTAVRWKKNCLPIFDRVQFQGGGRNLKNLRHTLAA